MEKWDIALLCTVFLTVLISLYDSTLFSLELSWSKPIDSNSYKNGHFPHESEKLPPPVISDVDGDGKNEVVIVSEEYKIYVFHGNGSVKFEASILPTVKITTGRKPVALASGYLTKTKDGVSPQQSIVVVTNGWTVLCFDHKLKLQWESSVQDYTTNNLYQSEIAVIISKKPLRKGDRGSVIIGGRLSSVNTAQLEDVHKEEEEEGEEAEISDEEVLASTLHFSYYAFDGRTGYLVWKHEAGDFYPEDIHEKENLMPEHSYKLHLFGTGSKHLGELPWRQFKLQILQQLPHYWSARTHTKFELRHFEKEMHRQVNPNSDSNIKSLLDTGNWFASQSDKVSTQKLALDEDKPNVFVAHNKDAIEVIHLYTGRPLTKLPTLPATLYADINNDEIIDQIKINMHGGDLFGVASSGISSDSKILFNFSLTEQAQTGLSRLFSDTREFVSKDRELKGSNPTLIESITEECFVDIIFFVSFGRLSSINCKGNINWQIDTTAAWDIESPTVASLSAFEPTPTDHKYILAVSSEIVLISPSGEIVTHKKISGDLIQPPVLGDFTNDGLNDIIITTTKGFYSYHLIHHNGYGLFQVMISILFAATLALLIFFLNTHKVRKEQD